MFQAIIFDLDGTLVDSLTDYSVAMNNVLRSMDFPSHPRDSYRYMMGDGLYEFVFRALPQDQITETLVSQCGSQFQDEYERQWLVHTCLYPGVSELLNELQNRSIKMAILSNKVDNFTRKTVHHFLSDYKFDAVQGACPTIQRKPHPESALAIASDMSIPPEHIIFLGDTETDMKTAVAAGMYPLGAAWDTRSEQELRDNGAQKFVYHPLDILRLFK